MPLGLDEPYGEVCPLANQCSNFSRSFIMKRHDTVVSVVLFMHESFSLALNICVMDVGWITPQPFVPLFSKNHIWSNSHGFPIALCCIVAGNDAVPFATIPKYHQEY